MGLPPAEAGARGGVFLAAGHGSEIAVRRPLPARTPYLADAHFGEFVLAESLAGPARVASDARPRALLPFRRDPGVHPVAHGPGPRARAIRPLRAPARGRLTITAPPTTITGYATAGGPSDVHVEEAPRGVTHERPTAEHVRLEGRPWNACLTFILVSSLFLLWGFCNGMIDVMDKHFQDELNLTLSQSAWVQFAHWMGHFLMSLPAGWLATRLGYKGGIIAGLLLVSVGGFWFIPGRRISRPSGPSCSASASWPPA